MTVDVIIGHGRDDDPQRVTIRTWIADRWATVHGLPVTFAECPDPVWSKGAAVNPAITASTADVVIVADADSYVDHAPLTAAIADTQTGGWAMPYSDVKRLDRPSTAAVLAGKPGRPRLERGPYPALPGGGIVIAHRDAWATVRGLDPRFRGWGGEDHALGLAMRILVGDVQRQRCALTHLWHPPAPANRRPAPATRHLDARYRAARRDPDAMRTLIEEWSTSDTHPAHA
jgi:hypothetical protein